MSAGAKSLKALRLIAAQPVFRVRQVPSLHDMLTEASPANAGWMYAICLDSGEYKTLNADLRRYVLLSDPEELALLAGMEWSKLSQMLVARYRMEKLRV